MKIPHALAELGTLTELKIDTGTHVYSYEFPKTGKNIMLLCTDAKGKTVYGLRGKLTQRKENFVRGKVADRYTDWSEYEPSTNRTITITEKKLFPVGQSILLSYSSDKWDGSHDYFHEFETNCTVSMDNDDDPKTVIIKGRSLRVTPKGVEG